METPPSEELLQPRAETNKGWLNGLLTCLRPVLFGYNKGTAEVANGGTNEDEWEVPFESVGSLRWLGSGAQGAVFLGDLHGHPIALKKVRDQAETEIRHLRRLRHPHLVALIGICRQPPCLLMEYCEGGPLSEVLRRPGPVPVVLWARQIASGIQHLHAHRIVHRDLKSANVLLGGDGLLKVSDFGTCRRVTGTTPMSFAGTVAWMAPEIIRHEPCSEKVDVWSYGVLLWELLTRDVPFRGVDAAAVLWGVGSGNLRLPLPESSPTALKQIIRSCWNGRPRNRPSFGHLLMWLESTSAEIDHVVTEERQAEWRAEADAAMRQFRCGTAGEGEEMQLLRQRREELRHARDVRQHYERKLDRANALYSELAACLAQLERRERELLRREEELGPIRKQCIVRPLLHSKKRRASTSPTEETKSAGRPAVLVEHNGNETNDITFYFDPVECGSLQDGDGNILKKRWYEGKWSTAIDSETINDRINRNSLPEAGDIPVW